MLGATRAALLFTFLAAAAIVPLGAMASLQHSSLPLDKRAAVPDVSHCYRDFATDPDNCPILNVAFFEDAQCERPLHLARTTPTALIKGNEQMLFDGAVAHSLKSSFGSIRVLAAVKGIGMGFAKEEESDTVVQNLAWMSSAQTFDAYESKACITFPNLDASQVGVWSVKFDDSFNQGGYVWNPSNIPLKQSAPQCIKRARHARGRLAAQPVCLHGASWGGGGVLLLYKNDDCTDDPKDARSVKKQFYSTVQCNALTMTEFKSFKAIEPTGPTIPINFSPAYYDLDKDGYHRCVQRDITTRPFKSGVCQKVAGNDMFVGVYGMDPDYPQPPPGAGDKLLLKAHGGLLLHPAPGHRRRPGHQ